MDSVLLLVEWCRQPINYQKMNLGNHERKELDKFLASIEPTLAGYKHSSFSYLAIKQDDIFVLTQGRLQLVGFPVPSTAKHFESASVKAGNFMLSEVGKTPKDFLELLLAGKLHTPHGELSFTANQNQSYTLYFDPQHMDGVESKRRQTRLTITGGNRLQYNPVKIDWELKGAPTPFDSLQELCAEYAVGSLAGNQVTIEIVAHNLAVVAANSAVRGSKALLSIDLADGLDPNKAAIGFLLYENNIVTRRDQIPGTKLTWTKADGTQHGSVEIDVPSGAVLQCIANYAGEAHHYFLAKDPSIIQNPHLAIYHAFDDKMEIIQELLEPQDNKPKSKRRDARDFESAIAWIFWMLGFKVAHLGGTPPSAEGPDLVVATPQDHFLVIECTTGILKAENKLANLVDRTEKARRSLVSSGNGHLKVLPVIVTNKTREEVLLELEQAEKSGIIVITREGLIDLINLTHLAPDPLKLYKEFEEKVHRAQTPDPFGRYLG